MKIYRPEELPHLKLCISDRVNFRYWCRKYSIPLQKVKFKKENGSSWTYTTNVINEELLDEVEKHSKEDRKLRSFVYRKNKIDNLRRTLRDEHRVEIQWMELSRRVNQYELFFYVMRQNHKNLVRYIRRYGRGDYIKGYKVFEARQREMEDYILTKELEFKTTREYAKYLYKLGIYKKVESAQKAIIRIEDGTNISTRHFRIARKIYKGLKNELCKR